MVVIKQRRAEEIRQRLERQSKEAKERVVAEKERVARVKKGLKERDDKGTYTPAAKYRRGTREYTANQVVNKDINRGSWQSIKNYARQLGVPYNAKTTRAELVARVEAKARTLSEPAPTTSQEFTKSLLEKQGYQATITDEGAIKAAKDQIQLQIGRFGQRTVKAPVSAQVQLEATPTYQQQFREGFRERQRRDRDPIIFEGTARTRGIGGMQEVAVPSREAADKGLAKKTRLSQLPILKQSEYLAGVMYEPQRPVFQASLTLRRERARRAVLGDIGFGFVEDVGEKVIGAYTATDTALKGFTQKYIPKEWELNLYKYADKYRKQPTFKQTGVAFFETVRTKDKVEPKEIRQPMSSIEKAFRDLPAAGAEFAGGYLGGLRRKPTKTLGMTALFFAVPFALKSVGRVVSPVTRTFAKYLPKTSKFLSKGVSVGIPLAYGGAVTFRASLSERPFAKLGEIAATEVTPMLAGSYLGAKVALRAEGYFRTLGTKDVEKSVGYPIMTERARAGRLDIYAQRRHLELFREAKNPFGVTKEHPISVLHASSGVKRTAFSEIIRKGRGQIDVRTPYDYLRGTFTSPSDKAAAAFLGVGRRRSFELYGGSIFDPYPTPTLTVLGVKGIRIRRTIAVGGKSLSGQSMRRFVGRDKPGYVDLPLIKTEPEGVVTGYFAFTKQISFVRVKGVRVPIREFRFIEKGARTSRAGSIATRYQRELELDRIFRQPVLTPGSFLPGLGRTSYISRIKVPKIPLYPSSSQVYKARGKLYPYERDVSSYRYSSQPSYSSAVSSMMSSLSSSYGSGYSSVVSKISQSSALSSSVLRSSLRSSLSDISGSYSSALKSSGLSSFGSGYSSKYGYSYLRELTYTPTPPPPIIGLEFPKRKKKKKKRKYGQRFKYQPSLIAVGERIFGERPPFTTGLFVRPVESPRRKRRKK